MECPTLDRPERLIFTIIYVMRGVSVGDLVSATGYDPNYVRRVLSILEKHGLTTRQGNIAKPAAWTVAP